MIARPGTPSHAMTSTLTVRPSCIPILYSLYSLYSSPQESGTGIAGRPCQLLSSRGRPGPAAMRRLQKVVQWGCQRSAVISAMLGAVFAELQPSDAMTRGLMWRSQFVVSSSVHAMCILTRFKGLFRTNRLDSAVVTRWFNDRLLYPTLALLGPLTTGYGGRGRCDRMAEPLGAQELNAMNADKDMAALKQYGGVEGLAKLVGSDLERGLDDKAAQASAQRYGLNKFKEVPPKSFFVLAYETAQDPIILLLMFAATISTVLGAAIPHEREKNGWIEGVAIWIAVIIVISVGAGNDWQKDRQFRKLNAQKDAIRISVVRNGEQCMVPHTSIVVGDVLLLTAGDKVVADGIALESFGLVVDEASLTGEGDPIHKNRDEDPWVRSGTTVTEGNGKMLVSAVGPESEWGKIMSMVSEEGGGATPLQAKLEVVAAAVGKVGLGVAIACFIALLFFLYAITIIVVAVPEGLPLAVTISLAYSMRKMMKDNNFVRVLAACETMGGATAICSDKTGTLTENRMTVVKGWFCGAMHDDVPAPEALPQEAVQALGINVAMTSK
ncbi:calcium-transporting ATPase, partial [Haematococcus lacustris]